MQFRVFIFQCEFDKQYMVERQNGSMKIVMRHQVINVPNKLQDLNGKLVGCNLTDVRTQFSIAFDLSPLVIMTLSINVLLKGTANVYEIELFGTL